MAVHFHTEDIEFKLPNANAVKAWVKEVIEAEGFKAGMVNYIFCSDDYLLAINKQYLDHDYYTDIITFDMSDIEDTIAADIFISIDRVEQNAQELGENIENELHRVLIHGILHLTGHDDKTEKDKKQMRLIENQYIKSILA